MQTLIPYLSNIIRTLTTCQIIEKKLYYLSSNTHDDNIKMELNRTRKLSKPNPY